MSDNWDDSDEDDWDKDDEELDARLNKLGISDSSKKKEAVPDFDDEEDLAIIEKAKADKLASMELKKKGNALQAKKQAELDRQEEEELARKAMELEAELESNMTPDQLRALKRQQVEEADNALTDDLFGGVDSMSKAKTAATAAGAAGDKVVMKDLKDHLKHARKVAAAIKQHGKIHLATAFLKEAISECKDVLDDDSIADIIKTCNVIKNEKMQAAKKKVKYQAQKSAKRDKTAEAKARQLQTELYGENDAYDEYDAMGHDYEDSFF